MIVGIDPSINHTGIALIEGRHIINVAQINTPAKGIQEKLTYLHEHIKEFLSQSPKCKVVLEQPPDYVASYGGRKKSVISIIHLSFAFGVIFGTCLSLSHDVILSIAKHKGPGGWQGTPTKWDAYNLASHSFDNFDEFIDRTKKPEKYYNITDALILAFLNEEHKC